MPIYEYRCSDCGQHKDYLQKISDTPIEACPACGSKAFAKAMTAAGFQLKGSGWYATDFKGGSSNGSSSGSAGSTNSTTESTSASSSSESSGGSCNPGCACH